MSRNDFDRIYTYRIFIRNRVAYDLLLKALDERYIRYKIEDVNLSLEQTDDEPFSFEMTVRRRYWEDELFELAVNGSKDAIMSVNLLHYREDRPIEPPKPRY